MPVISMVWILLYLARVVPMTIKLEIPQQVNEQGKIACPPGNLRIRGNQAFKEKPALPFQVPPHPETRLQELP